MVYAKIMQKGDGSGDYIVWSEDQPTVSTTDVNGNVVNSPDASYQSFNVADGSQLTISNGVIVIG